jgi:hypothetical protein
MKRISLLVVPLSIVLFAPPADPQAPKPPFQQRWVWAVTNLQHDNQADELIALIQRAARSGFNGLVLSDYRLNFLERVPEGYFKNVARVRQAADAAGVEIIPCVFPIGTSNGLLVHDPDLAEGVPVRDAPFVVDGRSVVPLRDFETEFQNGGLEQVSGHRFAGFSQQEAPGKRTFADRDESHGGRFSCRVEHAGRARHVAAGTPEVPKLIDVLDVNETSRKVDKIMKSDKSEKSDGSLLAQQIRVRPNACYRFSAWVKTRDLQPPVVRLAAVASTGFQRQLTYQSTPVEPTQDWTQIDVAFNTLDETVVTLGVSQPGGRDGTFWIDDLAIEELSLVNVLRRPGCPFSVTDLSGKKVYEEGKDYLPVRDDKLGRVPYPGEYEFHHPGAKLELTENSRIRDGQRLHVNWYHPIIIRDREVACCLAEPKLADLLREQAKRVNDLFKPRIFFMLHDEARVIGWCKACRDSHKTPAELLAANVRSCVEILKEINPRAGVVVWSDMFDPYHNAVRSGYYFVNGPLTDSWKGLPDGVAVANWNVAKPTDSLKWFAELGHGQIIAGHYDGDGSDVLRKWWEAAQGVRGVTGFMYTTWRGDYSQLETCGKMLRGE